MCYEIDKNHPFCRVTCTLFLVRWSAFLLGKPPCSPCRRPVFASGHHPWAETFPQSSWPPPKSDPKQQIWSLNHSLCFFVTDNNHYGWPCFTVVYEATEVNDVGKRQNKDFPHQTDVGQTWPRAFSPMAPTIPSGLLSQSRADGVLASMFPIVFFITDTLSEFQSSSSLELNLN